MELTVSAYGSLILTCSAFCLETETYCRDGNADGVCERGR
jgi:hypothetical protein